MRVGVVLDCHNPQIDPPSHYVSKLTAESICLEVRHGQRTRTAVITAVRISKSIIWLKSPEPFAEILRRHARPHSPARVLIPRLLPPTQPINLDLAYPEAWRITACLHHPHEAFKLGRPVAADLNLFTTLTTITTPHEETAAQVAAQ